MTKKPLIKPTPQFIGDNKATKKLYRLEEKRSEAVHACALEWQKLCDTSPLEYWVRAVPQAIFDMLESYETDTAAIAAQAFLERHGYTVTKKEATKA